MRVHCGAVKVTCGQQRRKGWQAGLNNGSARIIVVKDRPWLVCCLGYVSLVYVVSVRLSYSNQVGKLVYVK